AAPLCRLLLQFLTELTRLFQKCRTSGSVFITLKKYDGRTKPVPRKGHVESFEPADNKCLLRATDGKKKISTVVSDNLGVAVAVRVADGTVVWFHFCTQHLASKWCCQTSRKVPCLFSETVAVVFSVRWNWREGRGKLLLETRVMWAEGKRTVTEPAV
uniref:Signal recognition particle 14 kDa protein n=1 Tax=Anas zonorhyncha TaxID=75864 RepID=A0A8B9VFB2_9AVES